MQHRGLVVAAAVLVTGGSRAAKAAAGTGWNWGRGMRHCCDAKQPPNSCGAGGGGGGGGRAVFRLAQQLRKCGHGLCNEPKIKVGLPGGRASALPHPAHRTGPSPSCTPVWGRNKRRLPACCREGELASGGWCLENRSLPTFTAPR